MFFEKYKSDIASYADDIIHLTHMTQIYTLSSAS